MDIPLRQVYSVSQADYAGKQPECALPASPGARMLESSLVNPPLSAELWTAIHNACDAFEQAWSPGQRPRIEDYVDTLPEPGRSQLLWKLIRAELDVRCHLGEQPSAIEYRAGFPDCADAIDAWLADAQHVAAPAATTPPDAADAMQTWPDGSSALTPPRPEGADTLARPPLRIIGEYEVLERLGAGGMGEVYRARHRRLDRPVALTLLPGDAGASDQRVRRRSHVLLGTASLMRTPTTGPPLCSSGIPTNRIA